MVRIATFNLENLGTSPRQAVPLAARLDILRPQFERLNADILCLQEVNADRQRKQKDRELLALDELVRHTPLEDYHRAHTVRSGTDKLADKHNLVALSKWPILDHVQIWHDHVPPPAYRAATATPSPEEASPVTWDRPLLYCTIALPGGQALHVINLHLRAPLAAPVSGQKEGGFAWKSASGWAEGFYIAMLKRSGQALEVRLLIDRIFAADPESMIVVCGDFNAAEREVPARIISASVDDTANGELASRALVPLERTIPQSQRFSVIHHGEKLMLDHILVSHSLLGRYRHFEVHNELLSDELFGYSMIGQNPESYHAPVVAEFDL